jgi:hypothetical protein
VPPGPRLRDQLCELEAHDPLLRERYTQEIRAMLERKLTLPWKLFLAAVSVASMGITAFLGYHALAQERLPLLARLGMAGGALFAAAWAALGVRVLRRGTLELRAEPAAQAALVWVFAVLLETCLLLLAPQFPDHFQATVALFCGLVILVGAGVMLVNARVQQAELRTQEALLRLEYRIAEMADSRAKPS